VTLRECLEAADTEPERIKRAHAIDLSFEERIGDHLGNLYLIALQREAHRYFRTASSAGLASPHFVVKFERCQYPYNGPGVYTLSN
jgi:hypothetical protein